MFADYEEEIRDSIAKYVIARTPMPYSEAIAKVEAAQVRIEQGGEDQDDVLEELLPGNKPTKRILDIDAWWEWCDKKLDDPTQSKWCQDESYYTTEMEAIVQREFDKHGDSMGGLTQEMVAKELFDPARMLTKEEAIWAVSGHWEDDFLM